MSYVDVKQALEVVQLIVDSFSPKGAPSKSARSVQLMIHELQIEPDPFVLFETYRRILPSLSRREGAQYEADMVKVEVECGKW